jgi:phage gp46-like protein
MGYQIALDPATGLGTMSLQTSTDIKTGIYLSLNTKKGTLFQDPIFGLETIDKITGPNILVQKQNVESALNWLILAGSATSIDVLVEQDLSDISRLDVKVTATQASGYVVKYEQFIEVGN